MTFNDNAVQVQSELGTLRRLIIHSPDGGIGKVVPGKFKEWLYDDTVHLTQMRREYNQYIKLLLYFLDPEKIKYIAGFEKRQMNQRQLDCFKPDNPNYFNSDKVLDIQLLLSRILSDNDLRKRIISAVCAWEGCSFATEKKLEAIESATELAKVLITGTLKQGDEKNGKFVFAPLPNFIFTRDIAIALNDQLLLSNASSPARERESLLTKYVAHYELFKGKENKLIEISERSNFFLLSEEEQKEHKVSIEGGDVMMIAPTHLLIGCSERTTPGAINEVIHAIFKNSGTGIEKISIISIPQHRAMMHIDTVFTQVRKDVWVLFNRFSEQIIQQENAKRFSYFNVVSNASAVSTDYNIKISRFYKPINEAYEANKNYQQDISDKITGIESLLRNISEEDFGIDKNEVKIIYSGGNTFPYDEREQWTDACNLLALKDGVVVGYDRNEETVKSFIRNGFNVIRAEELFLDFEKGKQTAEDIRNTLILLPSAELSRARGGSHCMSMPLLRDTL